MAEGQGGVSWSWSRSPSVRSRSGYAMHEHTTIPFPYQQLLTEDPLTERVLPAGHSPHDEERLSPCCNGVGQWGVGRGVGQVLLTGEEPHERPAPLRDVVADGAT